MFSNEFVDVLNGDLDMLVEMSTGWLRLIVLLVSNRNVELKEFEKLFEQVYFDIVDLDYQTALDYLSYSRSCAFHFNLLINKISLNNLTVESLMRFTHKNKIDNSSEP